MGKWLVAEIKLVTDGSRQEPYEVKGCWEKPQAIRPTILAKRLRISKENWEARIPAREFLNTVTLTEA